MLIDSIPLLVNSDTLGTSKQCLEKDSAPVNSMGAGAGTGSKALVESAGAGLNELKFCHRCRNPITAGDVVKEAGVLDEILC